jgi:MarR family transcriptional regulator for hemolysin
MSNQFPDESLDALRSDFVHWLRMAGGRSEALILVHLKPYGLSLSHGRLLGIVADGALRGLVPVQKDLEEEMRLATSSITNLIQGLERRGLIERVASAQDGRAKEILLTREGWRVHRALGKHVAQWHRTLTGPLSDQELAVAVQLLKKLVTGVG